MIPTERSGACETEFQNASTIWPERVRPDLSVIVTETISGTLRPASSKCSERGEERGLEDERVEDGLDEEDVDPAVDEAANLLRVGRDELVEDVGSLSRVVHVHRERERPVRGADRARHEGVLPRRRAVRVHGLARDARGRDVQLVRETLQAVVGERDRLRVERVRLDDVGARLEVLPVDPLDDRRLREDEEVVRALQVLRVIPEALAAVRRLVQPVAAGSSSPSRRRGRRCARGGARGGGPRRSCAFRRSVRLASAPSASRIRLTAS